MLEEWVQLQFPFMASVNLHLYNQAQLQQVQEFKEKYGYWTFQAALESYIVHGFHDKYREQNHDKFFGDQYCYTVGLHNDRTR